MQITWLFKITDQMVRTGEIEKAKGEKREGKKNIELPLEPINGLDRKQLAHVMTALNNLTKCN